MSVQVPLNSLSLSSTVTSVAANIATALDTTQFPGVAVWIYVANTDSWIAQGASPTASAGAGSMFVPARLPVLVDGANGSHVSVIRDSADGRASLTPLQLSK